LNGSYCVKSRRLQQAFYARMKVASRPKADIQIGTKNPAQGRAL
jgi:hypothetical protein